MYEIEGGLDHPEEKFQNLYRFSCQKVQIRIRIRCSYFKSDLAKKCSGSGSTTLLKTSLYLLSSHFTITMFPEDVMMLMFPRIICQMFGGGRVSVRCRGGGGDDREKKRGWEFFGLVPEKLLRVVAQR
jgi:hypothetical protein